MPPTENKDCGVWCNVVRMRCPTCGLYYSWCLSHRRPTKAHRCTCGLVEELKDAELAEDPGGGGSDGSSE